ncbi:Cyclin-dependent kinase G-2 [Platanthera guangdongensis]|uniref:[RNA-polymerase]-subunit kinase n=1 Tax=Platanthera guangdongensis TaxID=2320717 RepID=A0ABR2M4U2_9ASPA
MQMFGQVALAYELPLKVMPLVELMLEVNWEQKLHVEKGCRYFDPGVEPQIDSLSSDLDGIFSVIEYMEHDLKGLMERMNEPFHLSEIQCLMLQLLFGVEHLHDNWVLHGYYGVLLVKQKNFVANMLLANFSNESFSYIASKVVHVGMVEPEVVGWRSGGSLRRTVTGLQPKHPNPSPAHWRVVGGHSLPLMRQTR